MRGASKSHESYVCSAYADLRVEEHRRTNEHPTAPPQAVLPLPRACATRPVQRACSAKAASPELCELMQ